MARSTIEIEQHHDLDQDGNPAGGVTRSPGLHISWQNGPLGRGEHRRAQSGAMVEDVLKAAIGRLEFYQEGRFRCEDNARALQHLRDALDVLDRRTADRERRGVEGSHLE